MVYCSRKLLPNFLQDFLFVFRRSTPMNKCFRERIDLSINAGNKQATSAINWSVLLYAQSSSLMRSIGLHRNLAHILDAIQLRCELFMLTTAADKQAEGYCIRLFSEQKGREALSCCASRVNSFSKEG